jgi:hypothetical protein
MLEDPQQLRTGKTAEQADDSGIQSVVWQARSPQLAPEQPEAGERGDGDERAETRDLEATDAEQDGIDERLPGCAFGTNASLCPFGG